MTPAVAQVPNAQAAVDATATFYLNQGVLGATCVLLLLIIAALGLGLGVYILARVGMAVLRLVVLLRQGRLL